MSKDESENENGSEQTLIPKGDEKEWLEVLHGEITATDDNATHVDATTIRNYLVARDEAIAINTAVDSQHLDTITAEEARVVYHQASERIRRRSKQGGGWNFLKTYGLSALIGALVAVLATVLFLNYLKPSAAGSSHAQYAHLNFSDYQKIEFNEDLGDLPNMLLIPGNITNIGCAKGWDDAAGGCRPTEFPSHLVTIDTFEISQHEVTFGQFRRFVDNSGYVTDAEKEGRGCVHEDTNSPGHPYVMNPKFNWLSPGYEQNDSFPVTCVSWHDAQSYVKWLSATTKTDYRLPTEAEWEHAARGGQSTAYFWGSSANSNQANYRGTGGKDNWTFTAPVGQFPANKYSVQDMSGNLWEWVADCWHPSYINAPTDGSAWVSDCKDPAVKVRRGGSWDMNASGIRSAIRSPGSIHDRSNLYGFRVARDWQKPKK
ncbi:MAG: formylglycine-generating enzyme family protein [Leucothrix sp.]